MKLKGLFKTTGLALAAVLVAAQADAASSAFATSNVNLRAGPSTSYPKITVVPAGASLINNGCLADYSWCDVSFANYRGWLSARYIQVAYQGQRQTLSPGLAFAAGIAVTAFTQSYWNNYYRGYPWYNTWGRYPPPPPPRPYRPPPGWAPPPHWGGPPPGWRAPPGYRPGWGPRPPYAGPPPRRPPPPPRRPPPPRPDGPPHGGPQHHGGPPPGWRPPHGGPQHHGGPPPQFRRGPPGGERRFDRH